MATLGQVSAIRHSVANDASWPDAEVRRRSTTDPSSPAPSFRVRPEAANGFAPQQPFDTCPGHVKLMDIGYGGGALLDARRLVAATTRSVAPSLHYHSIRDVRLLRTPQ